MTGLFISCIKLRLKNKSANRMYPLYEEHKETCLVPMLSGDERERGSITVSDV